METKRKRERILNSHMTDEHMMSKDTLTKHRDDNYSLFPY